MTKDLQSRVKHCKHLTYADLIKAPERIKNTPREKQWRNLETLAFKTIDPLIEQFNIGIISVFMSDQYVKHVLKQYNLQQDKAYLYYLTFDEETQRSTSPFTSGEAFAFKFSGNIGEFIEHLEYNVPFRHITYIERDDKPTNDYFLLDCSDNVHDQLSFTYLSKRGELHTHPATVIENFLQEITIRRNLKYDGYEPIRSNLPKDIDQKYYNVNNIWTIADDRNKYQMS